MEAEYSFSSLLSLFFIFHSPSDSAVLASSLFYGERRLLSSAERKRWKPVCIQMQHSWSMCVFSPETQFALKVLARDLVTRQPLPGASVDVYVNHTLRSSARAGQRGEVLLWVAYSPGLSLTLLGHMEGYVSSPLHWSTSKRPSE